MKQLIVLYTGSDWDSSIPYRSNDYSSQDLRNAYEYFARVCMDYGIQFGRASEDWYKGNGIFSRGWIYKDSDWIKQDSQVVADVVWDKTPWRGKSIEIKKRIFEDIPMVNHPELDEICSHKWKTYQLFKRYMPDTYVVKSEDELNTIVDEHEAIEFVLKPVSGSSAKGVSLYTGEEEVEIDNDKGMLLQEKMTASGVPGLIKKGTVGDLRLIIADGEIVTVETREITGKGFITNASRGGLNLVHEIGAVPDVVIPIFHAVDKKLASYGSRIYTIDFMFDEQGRPWIIELNSKQGFLYSLYEDADLMELLRHYNEAMIQSFLKAIETKENSGR